MLRLLFHNWPLKLIALITAITLWSTVTREPVAEIGFSVPIEFHNVPENLEITSQNIPQAQIRVRGPARLVREISAVDVHPIINLRNAGPGERTYELASAQINVPYDVEVVQVVPSQFRLSLDKRTSREVEVRPRVTGSFPAGYQLRSVSATPATVTIIGPERRVLAVDAALTDPIDASGVVGRATFTANAYVPDPLVRVVRPVAVHVVVETGRATEPPVPANP